MNQHLALLKISELLSRFKFQVRLLNSASMFDINIVAEDFLIPILNETFNCNLTNVNLYKKNYPAVDLIDNEKKICFQVTSTNSSSKIKETLEKIIKYELFKVYDVFIIFIIGEKKASGYIKEITEDVKTKFTFSNDSIIDIENLFGKIKTLSLTQILNIEKYLKSQYTDTGITNSLLKEQIFKLNEGTIENKSHKISQINSALKVRNIWYEKKNFLEQELPKIYDLNQKFNIYHSIEECNSKIEEYEKLIMNLTL